MTRLQGAQMLVDLCSRAATHYYCPEQMLTQNLIKEELSIAYTVAIASQAGFAAEITRRDMDSVDLSIRAKGHLTSDATLYSPELHVQLKAHVFDPLPENEFPFDLPVKNYSELIPRRANPIVLVVFVMPEDVHSWVTCSEDSLVLRRSGYWLSLLNQPPTPNERTQRVTLKRRNVFDPATLVDLMKKAGREEPL